MVGYPRPKAILASIHLVFVCLSDTIGNPTRLDDSGNAAGTYEFSAQGIAWPGEAKKYSPQPGYSDLSSIVPPPNWAERWPNGYTTDNPPPNLREDEHFQNWMRTAGLPTFSKLYGRNDGDTLTAGNYQMVVFMSKCSPTSRRNAR